MKRVFLIGASLLAVMAVYAQNSSEEATIESLSARLEKLEKKVESHNFYTPAIHGAIRSRWEGEFAHDDMPFEQRFQVRNARVLIEGRVLPTVQYYVRVDACDRGKFTFLDAWVRWSFLKYWKVQGGQFRIPYGMDCFRGPGTYVFANRSFLHKYLLNVRSVGFRAGYYPTSVPLTLEAGIFNATDRTNHEVWQRDMSFAAKGTYRIGNLTASASFASVRPDGIRINLFCAGATYSYDRWLVEAEYQNKHYTNHTHATTHGWNLFGVYGIPLDGKGIFNRLEFMARYDGMTNNSSGVRNDEGELYTTASRRQRMTLGSQLAYLRTPLKAIIRLNYEHFFYPSQAAPISRGQDDKIVAELIVKF